MVIRILSSVNCKVFAAAVVVAAALSPTSSMAAGPAAMARQSRVDIVRLQAGNHTLAPFAHAVFCLNNADQCQDTGGPSFIAMDLQRKNELRQVNRRVNRSIRPVNDQPGLDRWETDVTRGDCEDYVMTKRKQLLALGWSSRALLIAVATTRQGEGHAVLVVKTDEGDVVLDNRTSAIKDWRRTDLSWVKIQSAENPKYWLDMNSADLPIALVDYNSDLQTAEIGN